MNLEKKNNVDERERFGKGKKKSADWTDSIYLRKKRARYKKRQASKVTRREEGGLMLRFRSASWKKSLDARRELPGRDLKDRGGGEETFPLTRAPAEKRRKRKKVTLEGAY